MIEVSPSVLAADPMRLEEELAGMIRAGCGRIHLDIMDGHFVPNLSFGPALLTAIRKSFPHTPVDAHLMVDNPESFVRIFAEAGADTVVFHLEAASDADALIDAIHASGAKAGISLRPQTGEETLRPFLDGIEQVLVMTVNPGFGGQKMMPDMLRKAAWLRQVCGWQGDIAVDGGINAQNAPDALKAGANILVMGTALFRAADPAGVIAGVKAWA